MTTKQKAPTTCEEISTRKQENQHQAKNSAKGLWVENQYKLVLEVRKNYQKVQESKNKVYETTFSHKRIKREENGEHYNSLSQIH